MNPKLHFALALILCAACKKEEPAPAPPSEVAVVPPAAETAKPATTPAAAAVDVASLPVEEDFEVEAEEEVTPASLNETLDRLEKEIGTE
ncbi:MAG TPA: hypothetical protein VFZ53_15325 [Polyangiaceae bacterium]